MSRYSVGRTLASIVIWAGFIAIGIALLVLLASVVRISSLAAGAPAAMIMVLWGSVAALVGHVSRAVFDIADATRGPVQAAPVHAFTPIPLATRDPG